MDFIVENGLVSFTDDDGASKAYCWSNGYLDLISTFDGKPIYDLTKGYPHKINDTVCNNFAEFLIAWVDAGGLEPPNYDQVVQWLGKTYKSDVDDMYYIEDKTDYGNDVLIGDNPVIVGNGLNVGIQVQNTSVLTTKRYEYMVFVGEINDVTKTGGLIGNSYAGAGYGRSNIYIYRSTLVFLSYNMPADIALSNGYYKIILKIDNITNTATGYINGLPVTSFTSGLRTTYLNDFRILSYGNSTNTDDSSLYSDASVHYSCFHESDNDITQEQIDDPTLIGNDDSIVLFRAQVGNGSYCYNIATKEKLYYQGDLTNIHGTSSLQTPYAHLNGCDVWYDSVNDLYKYTPLQDDGTSCQGELDTDDDGYVWQYKVAGIGLEDKEGTNGTETLYQPEASTELKALETANFTTRIWYDVSGNALPIDAKDITWNHEDANVQFADVTNPPYVSNYIVYDTPQTGQNLEDIKDFVNFKTPSLDFSDEGNSQYITLL